MKYALLFKEGEDNVLVSAEDVKNGLYSRYEEFVDPEYEFKVCFVRGAKNNGGPYFRLYYSYEEYKRLFPDRADRYQIVANMRRYQESQWHREWKDRVSSFCTIEKYIKNSETGKHKFADAYYDQMKICIEFQHSYIAFDFEERNEFYSKLGIKTIWLYDLPHANICEDEDGNIEILEDNARGFFRISEDPNNLKNNCVFVQVKSGIIYRITELLRRETTGGRKSTIRYFVPTEVYTADEFVQAIMENKIKVEQNPEVMPKPLAEIWDNKYSWMIVENVSNNEVIYINRDRKGEMYRDISTNCIQYKYIDGKYGDVALECKKAYSLSHSKEKSSIWILVRAKYYS